MRERDVRHFWDEEGRRLGLTPVVLIIAKGGRNEAARGPCRAEGSCRHLRGGVCEVFSSGCRPEGCPHYTTEEGR